jgi:hypothetical protein
MNDIEEEDSPESSDEQQHKLNEIYQRMNEELALSAIHRKHVESHWRQVLRKEKFQELRNDIGSLQQYHEQTMQQKKDVIKSLQNETVILQQLHHGAVVANINLMENMIEIHDEQVVLLEKSFRERLTAMQSQFQKDIEMITTQYEQEKNVVQNVIDRHHEKEERRYLLLQLEQHRELDEIETRHKENNVRIKRHLDVAIKNFQERFEQTHEEYTQRNHVTKKVYEELKIKNDEMKKKIRQTRRRANHIQTKVQQIRLVAQKEKFQRLDRFRALLERKTRALETFQLIKDDMIKFRKNHQEKLVALSRRANERKESLQKQCAIAERIKKIAACCQQLETSREQFASILRGLSSPNHDDDDAGDQGTYANYEDNEHDNNVKHEASKLVAEEKNAAAKSITIVSSASERALLWEITQRFWDKYNLAQVDVLRQQKSITELKRREVDLQNKLIICRNGVTVNNDVFKDRNPLLVINGKINGLVPDETTTRKKRLTVVEGNHFLATLEKRQHQ